MKTEKIVTLMEFPRPDTLATECSLLNAALNDTQYLPELQRILRPEYFYEEENRKIWNTIVEMYQNGERIDTATIYQRVNTEYLIDSIFSADTTFGKGIVQLAEDLATAYIMRRSYDNAVRTLQAVKEGEDAGKVLSYTTELQHEIETTTRDNDLYNSLEIAQQLRNDLEEDKLRKIPVPFPLLNYLTYGGFSAGSLVVLAARPSVGKTTLALQMALKASREGHKAMLFSLEMSSKDIIQRIILGTGHVTSEELALKQVDWKHYSQAVNESLNENFLINDRAYTLEDIISRMTLESKRRNCDIVFIDYLGLIRYDDRRKSQTQLLGEITASLKKAAKDCNIPVVLLCQLNRESAKEGRAPQLYDLRDSGNIEQDGDVILMLEQPRDEQLNIIENRIDLWVRKNRFGKRTDIEAIHLKGNENYFGFKEIEFEPRVITYEQDEDDQDRDSMPF